MHRMLAGCPVCGGALHVTEVQCNACGASVRSDFEPCRFCRLTREQHEFVMLFLRHRGNISSVCDEMHLSYPTVSKRLEAALAALEAADDSNRRVSQPALVRDEDLREVLDMLDRGEITAEEATKRLKEM